MPWRHRQGLQHHPGQLQVDQVADTFDRADLDLGGETRPHGLAGQLRGDGQHEGGVALQLHVADDGHTHAVFAVVQVDTDGRLLQHHGQAAPQVVHQRLEAQGQVVVDVGAEAFHPAGVAEGGQVAGQGQGVQVQLLWMHGGRTRQVGEHRFVPVDGLQQQEVGHFGNSPAAGLGHAAGQGVATLAQQPQQFFGEAAQQGVGGHVEQGRDVLAVEHHLVVGAALLHLGHGQRRPGVGGFATAQQPGVELAELQQGGAFTGGVGVGHLLLQHPVAHQVFEALHIRLAGARTAQGQGQHDGLVAHVRGDVHRIGQRVYRRHVEHGAVGKHPGGAQQGQLAQRQRRCIDFQRREAPCVGRGRAQRDMPHMVGVAFVLLQMLGLQQHALAPDYLFAPTHGCSVVRWM